MNLEPQATPPDKQETREFASPPVRKPLVLLWDTERSLRLKTVETLAPILPETAAKSLQKVSKVADTSFQELAAIDLDLISDAELRSPRIFIGLTFAGFSALAIVFLLLCSLALHPHMTAMERIHNYWYQYVFCVGFGIAGMFVLAREAMRSSQQQKNQNSRTL